MVGLRPGARAAVRRRCARRRLLERPRRQPAGLCRGRVRVRRLAVRGHPRDARRRARAAGRGGRAPLRARARGRAGRRRCRGGPDPLRAGAAREPRRRAARGRARRHPRAVRQRGGGAGAVAHAARPGAEVVQGRLRLAGAPRRGEGRIRSRRRPGRRDARRDGGRPAGARPQAGARRAARDDRGGRGRARAGEGPPRPEDRPRARGGARLRHVLPRRRVGARRQPRREPAAARQHQDPLLRARDAGRRAALRGRR